MKMKGAWLPSGQEANHKENSFETRSQAFSTLTGKSGALSTYHPITVNRGQKGSILQNRASFLFQVLYSQQMPLPISTFTGSFCSRIGIANRQLQPWDVIIFQKTGWVFESKGEHIYQSDRPFLC